MNFKGQASIENLAMVASILAIIIPIVLFMLAMSSGQSSSFYQRHLYESMDILKRNIEETYAFCPGERQFYVYLPQIVQNVTFSKYGERAMLVTNYVLEGKQNSFSVPINTVNNNIRDYTPDLFILPAAGNANNIKGGGIVRISINCSVEDDGNLETITLKMTDMRG